VLDNIEFFFEGDGFQLLGLHAAAEDIAEFRNSRAGAGGILVDQGSDAIEGVEDEMGVDMRFYRLQFQFLYKGFQFEGIKLLFGTYLDVVVEIVNEGPGDDHEPGVGGDGEEPGHEFGVLVGYEV